MPTGALSQTRLSPLTALGMMFLAYAMVSLVWGSENGAYAFAYLLCLVASFTLGRFTKPTMIWIGTAVLSLLLLASTPWLIVNPNVLGCFFAISLSAAIAYRLWYIIPPMLFGLWFAASRGALFAAGVACLIGLWRRTPFLAICLALIAIILMLSQKPGAESLFARLGVWQDTINHLTPFGHGWGSFANTYASWPVHLNMGPQVAPHAYNDYLELVSDLGIGSLPLFLLLIIAWENHNPPAKLILLTFFALSLTYFPLWIPIVGHLAAYTLGNLTRQERT